MNNYDEEHHEPNPDPYGTDSHRADKAIVKGLAIAVIIWILLYLIA